MHTCIPLHELKRSWHSCPRWVNASNKKHTQHAPSTKTECDHLHGWIKKNKKKNSHIRENFTPKMVNPRDTAGNTEEKKRYEKKHVKQFVKNKCPILKSLPRRTDGRPDKHDPSHRSTWYSYASETETRRLTSVDAGRAGRRTVRQTGRQTDRLADRQTGRQTDRLTDWQTRKEGC